MSDQEDMWRAIRELRAQVKLQTKLTGSLLTHSHQCVDSMCQSSTPIYHEQVECPKDNKPCDREIKACCSCERNK